MPRLSRILAVLLLAATALPASALPLKILGLDDMSCAAWTRTKAEPEQRLAYVQWIRGFLTGHNYASQAKQVSVVSNGTIAVFIDRQCNEKPATSVVDAAMKMSDDYSGRNAPITR